MSKRYVPERGDFVWLQFDPQAGHEQAGRRPALVISPAKYNEKTSLAICCPVTSQVKGYPFEVPVNGKKITGVVLADQVKSLDWRARKAALIEKIEPGALAEVQAKVAALIQAP